MALKWIGSMLVLFSAGGFGIWSAMQWRERLRLLEKLRQMIYFLKGEITYSHARQEGESLQEIWRREVQVLSSPKIRLPLTEEDLEQLAGLGEHLGYLDVDMQERTLGLYLEQLDISIEYLRTNQREKCRLYTSLGIMGGMFLVIVMY